MKNSWVHRGLWLAAAALLVAASGAAVVLAGPVVPLAEDGLPAHLQVPDRQPLSGLLAGGRNGSGIAVSTDRFGYTGVVRRYATLADAQQGINQIGDDTAISNRDLALYVVKDLAAYDDDINVIMGSWWYTTAENTNGYPKDHPDGDRLYSGHGNTRGNSGRGFLQLYDEDGSTDLGVGAHFGAFDGSHWTELHVYIAGQGADSANDYARFWVDFQGSGADRVIYHSYTLDFTATGLQGVETAPGFIEATNHPTGVSGTYTGIFENISTTFPENNGFYTFELVLDMDNWSFSVGDEALNGNFYDSYFAGGGPLTEVWVDDDYCATCTNDGHTWGVDAFATIQGGINGVTGSTVNVGPGTYEEQVVITTDNLQLIGAGSGDNPAVDTIIRAPVSLTSTFNSGSYDAYPVVTVMDCSGSSVQNLRVDGYGRGNGNVRFIGVAYWNAGGELLDAVVTNIQDTPFSGAQHGVAIYAYNNTGGPYSLAVTNVEVTEYQKNAMALSGDGLTVSVTGCTTTGKGATSVTAQNGIQVSYGAGGTITDCTVSGNIYTGSGWAASGILPYDCPSLHMTGNTVIDNYVGVYAEDVDDGSFKDGTVSNQDPDSWDGIYVKSIAATLGGEEIKPIAPAAPLGEDYVRGPGGRANRTFVIDNSSFTGHGKDDSWGVYFRTDADTLTASMTNCQVTGWWLGVYTRENSGTVDATINRNGIFDNSGWGLYSTTALPVDAEYNFWGDATGPFDPDGTNEAEAATCFDPATMKNADGGGNAVSDANIDYCPWLATNGLGLTLEVDDTCYQAGEQVTVDIVLNGNTAEVLTGLFFLSYDTTSLSFVSIEPGDAPFTVEEVETVDTMAGTIAYTVGVPTSNPPAGYAGTAPIVMATATFDVIAPGGENCWLEDAVAWRTPTPPFVTRLAQLVGGLAQPLYLDELVDADPITIDYTAPVVACPADITVDTDAGVCTKTLDYIEPFDNAICTNPTQTPNCWYRDRFIPAVFENFDFGGENVLRHGVDAADFQGYGNFYATQGRKYDLDMPVGTTLGIDFYLPADWDTKVRSTGIWATTFDSNSNVSGYPILAFSSNDPDDPSNVTPANPTPRFRWYTQDTDQNPNNGYQDGYVDFYTPTAFGVWYRLEIELTNSAYIFTVKDAGGTVLATATDVVTFGSLRFGNVILQAYNFGETYDFYWDNLTVGPIVGGPVVTENCGDSVNATLTYERSDGAGLTLYDPFPIGATTITWTATDCAGNVGSCVQTVLVEDNEDPVIDGCPGNISQGNDAGDCGAVVNWTAPTASDNCGIQSFISTHNPGDTFPVGDTVVTYTATDVHGNVSVCSFTVTVTDDEDPTITCPANISQTADADVCQAAVTVPAPATGDNCAVASVVNDHNGTADASDTYPVGTTVVTWTVTDIHGNTAQCSMNIEVTDDEYPVISGCPGNISQSNDLGVCGAAVTWTEPTATDNCGVTSWTSSHNPGAFFPVGTTTVSYTAEDAAGNTTICEFYVTITDDEDPVITGCPNNITQTNDAGDCGAIVTWIEPTATDNCGVTGWTSTHNPGDFFPVGITTVTYTAVDAAGNTTTCVFDVTVTDAEYPTITCPSDIVVDNDLGDCSADVTVPAPVTDDNCTVASVVNDYNGTSDASDTYPVGTTTVIWTVTDSAGLQTQCSMDVTVNDTEDPVIAGCPADITIQAEAGGCDAVVDWTEPTATDNCGMQSFTSNYDPGDTFNAGTTTVTYTAVDIYGNVSTCSFNVTVLAYNDLLVDVELQGSLATDVTRCITFTFFDCDGATEVFERDIDFDYTTGLGQADFTQAFADGIPCGAYDCVLVQDKLHTLTRRFELGGSNFFVNGTGQYVIDATGGELLLQGDLYDDYPDWDIDWIDAVDIGVYIASWGFTSPSGDTLCGVYNVHADIDGDGALDTTDRAFITTNYLVVGESVCCVPPLTMGPAGQVPGPRTSITTDELRAMGLYDVANRADLNSDGVVDWTDWELFLDGVVPGAAIDPVELPPAVDDHVAPEDDSPLNEGATDPTAGQLPEVGRLP